MRPFLDDRDFSAALLLVSEAVTNAVVHGAADGPIHVTAAVDGGVLHVEVENEPRTEGPAHDAGRREGGLGLRLFEQLAEDWGIEHRGQTVLWFDVPAGDAPR